MKSPLRYDTLVAALLLAFLASLLSCAVVFAYPGDDTFLRPLPIPQTVGPIDLNTGRWAYGASTACQILIPLIVGVILAELGKRKGWWVFFGWPRVKLVAGLFTWKYACDLGFFCVQWTPGRAWMFSGLLAYTVVQFVVFHLLGECLLRDQGAVWLADKSTRWLGYDKRPVPGWLVTGKRLCARFCYEDNDALDVNAPFNRVVAKFLVVCAAAAASWPAYDVATNWLTFHDFDPRGIYGAYSYRFLMAFTVGGYLGRIWAYNFGEWLYGRFVLPRIWPVLQRLLGEKGLLALARAQATKWGQVLVAHDIGGRMLTTRVCAVICVAFLLPWLAKRIPAAPTPAGDFGQFRQAMHAPEPRQGEVVFDSPESSPAAVEATAANPAAKPEDWAVSGPRFRVHRPIDREFAGCLLVSTEEAASAKKIAEEVLFTVDGSLPAWEIDKPAVSTERVPESGELRPFAIPVLLRAATIKNGSVGQIRSQLLAPNLCTIVLPKYPKSSKRIKAVYVTGSFRDWQQDRNQRFRLLPNPEGQYECQVMLDASTNIYYKFLVEFDDGTMSWHLSPDLPKEVFGEHENHVLNAAVRLKDCLRPCRDGIVEESLVNCEVLDVATGCVRIVLTLLNNDVETVALHVPGCESQELEKVVFRRYGLEFAAYHAFLRIPEKGLETACFFTVEDAKKLWYAGPKGASPCPPGTDRQHPAPPPSEHLIRLSYDPPRPERLQTSPYPPLKTRDLRSRTIYFAIVDRFCDGDPLNNTGLKVASSGKRDESASEKDKTYDATKSNPAKYFGGDLQGLRSKLPYLKELGIGAIWVTPLVKNFRGVEAFHGSAAFHGYWAQDFFRLDEHFGTWEDLRLLIKEMHDLDMLLILDFAPNHTSPTYITGGGRLEEDGKIVSESYEADAKLPVENQIYYHEGGMSPGEEEMSPARSRRNSMGLADLRTENKFVADYLVRAAKLWLSKDVDGFRIDSLKHFEASFAGRITQELNEEARKCGRPGVYIAGEWMGGGAFSYPSLEFANQCRDCSLLDFGLKDRLTDVLSGNHDLRALDGLLQERRLAFGGRDNRQMTFLDNHDARRIGTILGDVIYGAGFPRPVFERLMDLGMVLVMTAPGVPTIYYGTEQYAADLMQDWDSQKVHQFKDWQGREVRIGEDPRNRSMMPGFATNKPIFSIVQKLSQLRRQSLAVQRGAYRSRYAAPNILVFERQEDDDVVLVAVNRGPAMKEAIEVLNLALPDGGYSNVLDEGNGETPRMPTQQPLKVQVKNRSAKIQLPEYGAVVLYKAGSAKPPSAGKTPK